MDMISEYECKTCKILLIGRNNYIAHCKDVHDEIISRADISEYPNDLGKTLQL